MTYCFLREIISQMKYEASADPFTVEVSHIPTEIDYEDEWIHDYRTHILGERDDQWIDWDVSINGHTQYVCSGLGVSGPKILQFRFLNPSAIGLITLSKNSNRP